MKALPIIYSRTKYVDFVPDFLVRPADIDVSAAVKYVSGSLADIDTVSDVRYSVFCAGKYAVYGISCYAKTLSESVGDGSTEYTQDVQKRRTTCFIGYAFPISRDNKEIPMLTKKDFWDLYLMYIPHQWEYPSGTKSEKVSSFLEVAGNLYTPNSTAITLNGERVGDIIDISYNADVVNHIMFASMQGSADMNYISQVNTIELFSKLNYKFADLSKIKDKIKQRLKAEAERNNVRANDNSSTIPQHIGMNDKDGFFNNMAEDKRRSAFLPAAAIVSAAIVVAVVVIVLLILT